MPEPAMVAPLAKAKPVNLTTKSVDTYEAPEPVVSTNAYSLPPQMKTLKPLSITLVVAAESIAAWIDTADDRSCTVGDVPITAT